MAERTDERGVSDRAADSRTEAGAGATTLTARPALGPRVGGVEVRELADRSLVTIVLPPAPASGRDRATSGVPDEANGGGEAVRRMLERAFGVTLPALGDSAVTDRGERLLGLQTDRLYVMFDTEALAGTVANADPGAAVDPERALRERLGTTGPGSPMVNRASSLAGDGSPGRTDGGSSNSTDDVSSNPVDDDSSGQTDAADRRDDPDSRAPTLYLNDQSDSWVMLRVAGAGVRRALERLCPLDLHPDAFAPGAVARTVMEHLAVIVLHEAEDTFVLLSPRSSAASFLHEIETSVRWTRDVA